MRWFAVFAVVALLLVSVFSVLSEQDALPQAPVLQTEYERRWVDSDGTVIAQVHTQPFQARRGAGWVPIDTTLAVRADGMVAPVAAVGDVVFSPGGDGPLVRLAQMSLTWPTPLPRPVLAGDTATYPQAAPGVDVVLTARPAGFSLTFTLTTPHAREIRVFAEKVKSGPGGTVTAGQVWGGPVGMRDAAGRTARAVRSVRPGVLTVRPAQAMLDARWTRYPVAVTQEFSADPLSWMVVGQSVAGQGYVSQWRPAGTATAGVSGEYDYRAYFELTAVPVHGKQVRAARLRIPACQRVEAWHIGAFGPATTWMATEYRELIGVTDCGEVDVTALMTRAAEQGWQRVSVAFAVRKDQHPAQFGAPLVEVRYR
ncbi:hypothetical protein DMH04_33070 [Kibdelosporangium aridum]|uniref:Uncharacterized protein n=1 Tax=Kibdelosporangium aridum TaxID=2030 RepID=A0A428Z1H8_KIBAR|nr:hypothetical protein [Kibdelosporangium aridum]RSM78694.1 hypothetical protein DMH04_33070 [Kibdelosporangium aridum]